MKVPDGLTEEQVLATIEKVVKRLAYKFQFGYHSIEDMRQHGRMEALEALADYDNKRPLENFLYTCVRNSLHNLKRNKFERLDKPCHDCPLNAYIPSCDGCKEFSPKTNCELYYAWLKRNTTKKNVMTPIELGEVRDENENNMKTFEEVSEVVATKELWELFDKKVPLELRADYLKLRHGVKITKGKKDKIINLLREIVNEDGIS